jgi:hypothetical protein
MAGNFSDVAYESDLGFVCLIRISDGELAATTASQEAVDAPFHCLNSGSRRKFGIHPRGLVLSRVVGIAPNQFNKTSFLAAPTAVAYNAAVVGSELSVGGNAWTVAGKRPESQK